MKTFVFKACNKEGGVLNSSLDADNEFAAMNILDRLGYVVLSLQESSQEGKKAAWGFFRRMGRGPDSNIIFISRQLSTLLRSGVTLSDALEGIVEQTRDKRFKAILGAVLKEIYGGASFSSALMKYPQEFPEIFTSLVRVGEASGILEEILARLSQIYAQKMNVQMRIRSAVTYPVILLIAAVGIVNFLLINILPKFTAIFATYEVKLPFLTQLLLGVSQVMQKFWLFALFLAVFTIAIVFWCFRSEKVISKIHGFLLKIPVIGPLYMKVIMAQMTRSLGFLLKSGVPLLEAIQTTANTIGNIFVRKAVLQMKVSLAEGRSLTELFRGGGIFPAMVLQMVSLGEKTGHLDQMLLEVASFYDQEVEYELRDLTTALEPMLLLVMGLMVAFIALSVLLPIFNLIKVFR